MSSCQNKNSVANFKWYLISFQALSVPINPRFWEFFHFSKKYPFFTEKHFPKLFPLSYSEKCVYLPFLEQENMPYRKLKLFVCLLSFKIVLAKSLMFLANWKNMIVFWHSIYYEQLFSLVYLFFGENISVFGELNFLIWNMLKKLYW